MGFRITWDMKSIQHQIQSASIEMNSPYNDGFTAWAIKKSLLELKFYLDNVLEKSPNFGSTEQEYLEEQIKIKTWRILSEK